MALRAIHNRLVDDYGIPYWGSYILFAFATILLGAILGLLIVCVIDLIFPAKMTDDMKDHKNSNEKSAKYDVSDLIDDQIIDENSSDESNTELRRRKKTSEDLQTKENDK